MPATQPSQQPAQRLPIRHHGGSCVTGQLQPWRDFDFARGFPEVHLAPRGVEVVEAGGPLDAPDYVPSGGAEVYLGDYEGATPVVFFHEPRERF